MSIKNTETTPSKEEKKATKKDSVNVVQVTDWGKKIKEYTLKVFTFIKEFALQIVMVIASIMLFSMVTAYFGLTVMQGLMVFGGIALLALVAVKLLDGSASQTLEKVQTKLAAPQAQAA